MVEKPVVLTAAPVNSTCKIDKFGSKIFINIADIIYIIKLVTNTILV